MSKPQEPTLLYFHIELASYTLWAHQHVRLYYYCAI